MADTGAVLPQSATTASESPWSDNDWTTPENIYGAGEASVTAATYDAGDQTYVLKAYNFDFSAIPSGSTIDGVVCVITARYATAAVSIDLVQLLDTSLAKVGNNLAGPTALTTSSAPYTFGTSTEKWGNALTDTWVKNSNFGVAVGMLAGSTGNSNNDVYVDSVTLQVYYTAGAQQYTKTITTTEAISDSKSRVSNFIRTLTTTEAISDIRSKVAAFDKVLTLVEAISDSVANSVGKIKLLETTEAISDSISKAIGFAKTLYNTVNIVNYPNPTDDFNRTSLGANWTVPTGQTGTPSISGDQLVVATGACKLYWNNGTYNNDQFSEAKQYGSGWRGVTVRESGTTGTNVVAYVCWLSSVSAAPNIRLGWHNGGSGFGEYLDSGGTAVGTVNAGDILRIEVSGQGEGIILKAYINGVLKKTLTKPEFTNQNAIINSGQPGVYFSSTDAIFDDFTSGNLEYPISEAGFNKSVSNSVGVTDLLSKVAEFATSVANSVGITDIISRASNIVRDISDNLGITDLITAETLGSIIEKLLETTESISDSISTSVGRAVALFDNIGITDAISKVINYSKAMVESVGITDAANKVVDYIRTISVTEAISDSMGAFSGLVKLITDSVGITDAVSKIYNSVRTMTTMESISDNMSKSVSYIRTLTTQEGITDLVNKAIGYVKSVADSVGITDFIDSVVQSFNNYETTIQDTEGLSDSIARQMSFILLKSETESISDSVAKALLLAKLLSDSIGLTDTVNKASNIFVTILTTANISDSINRTIQYVRNIVSSISISDAITAILNYVKPFVPHVHLGGGVSKKITTSADVDKEARLSGSVNKKEN